MNPNLREIADVFLKEIKETPRLMFSPLAAAWKQIKENAQPEKPQEQRHSSNDLPPPR